MNIHPTAIIHPKAKLGKAVTVGPYSVIKEGVTVGDGAQIGSFCVLEGNTQIGKECQFFTGAVIGSIPQDKKFKGDQNVFLSIGDNNIFREYVTLNPGTGDGGKTVIGNDNLLMAYSHVAHDCVIGNHCVIANNGTLAGHVIMEDMAVLGGLAAVHQFVRIGALAIVGGCSKVVQDIPPYSTCDGHPARVYGLNAIGLKRAKIPFSSVQSLKKAFKILFFSGLTKSHALEKIQKDVESCEQLKDLVKFIESSTRGICGSALREKQEAVE